MSPWLCSGCGVASKDRERLCDCATVTLFRMEGDKIVHATKDDDDIVQQLRSERTCDCVWTTTMADAADEIERLRLRSAALTPLVSAALDKLEEDLNWRGPKGRVMGYVLLPRERAIAVRDYLKRGKTDDGDRDPVSGDSEQGRGAVHQELQQGEAGDSKG